MAETPSLHNAVDSETSVDYFITTVKPTSEEKLYLGENIMIL